MKEWVGSSMKIVERVKEHHINIIMKTGIYLKIFIHKLINPFLLFAFLFLLPTLFFLPSSPYSFSPIIISEICPPVFCWALPMNLQFIPIQILFPLKVLILCVCHKVVDTRYFEKLELHLTILKSHLNINWYSQSIHFP